jgi:hypothetical protein
MTVTVNIIPTQVQTMVSSMDNPNPKPVKGPATNLIDEAAMTAK